MRRRRRERVKPMPTEEEKRKAQLKAASADPLVWAMKSVDDKFPDEREKDAETIEAEAEVEMRMSPNSTESMDNADVLDDIDEEIETDEIHAEGKTVVPMDDGAMTVDVSPMRQNVDNVTTKEVNKVEGKKTQIEEAKKAEAAKESEKSEKIKRAKDAKSEFKEAKKIAKARKIQKPQKMDAQIKRLMFAIGVLIIVALFGVGFGIAAMINQKNVTAEIANQIVTSSGHEDSVDNEYVYLKDWNMKIKIISGLEHVTFDYDETNDGYSKVLIWATRKEDGANYTPDFAKQSKNSSALGIVTRIPRYERAAAGRLIWYDDYYNYYYQGPTSEPEASESEMSWWVESYLLVKEMLTNADNYIKFDDSTISQQ